MSITVAQYKFNYFRHFILVAMIGLALCACANDTNFDRHNLSRLWQAHDGSAIYFDASTNAKYPIDSEVAEATRQEWIAQWLKLRNLCLEGHAVVEKRAIGRDEDNPHRHDQRYTIACN